MFCMPPITKRMALSPALKQIGALTLLLWLSSGQAANQKPVANAGNDFPAELNSAVQLHGEQSYDPDGQIVRYRWQQIKGSKVQLNANASAAISFKTPASWPKKNSASKLVFKLTVTDNGKKRGSDTVNVQLISCPAEQKLIDDRCQTPPQAPVCLSPKKWQNGQCVLPPPLICAEPLIAEQGVCRLPPTVCSNPLEVVQNGICAPRSASTALNDTGIVLCSDAEKNGAFCPFVIYPGQDAEFGRDLMFNDNSDGHAGFSFGKLDQTGKPATDNASEWSCIQDRLTGLIWEVKTDKADLHDKDRQFRHHASGEQSVAALIAAVNNEGLCGAQDWRLPTVSELQGIVDYSAGFPGPAIDQGFFIHADNAAYWTSHLHASNPDSAWAVHFEDGRIFPHPRDSLFKVRLVRGGNLHP